MLYSNYYFLFEPVHGFFWRVKGVYTVKTRLGEKEIGETENIVLASVVRPRVAPDPKKVTEGSDVQKWMRAAAM